MEFKQAFAANPSIRLMRLHQPIGVALLLWPCWWSVALLSKGKISLDLFLAFAAGAVLMRAAGCIINDLWDRDIDKQVARTRNRPLASGELNVSHALILLSILLLVSAFI